MTATQGKKSYLALCETIKTWFDKIRNFLLSFLSKKDRWQQKCIFFEKPRELKCLHTESFNQTKGTITIVLD